MQTRNDYWIQEEVFNSIDLGGESLRRARNISYNQLDAASQVLLDQQKKGQIDAYPANYKRDKNEYQRVKVPGDGDCLFHSTAMGMLNLIRQGKMDLTTYPESHKALSDAFQSSEAKRIILQRISADPIIKEFALQNGILDGNGNLHLDDIINKLQKNIKNLDKNDHYQSKIGLWMYILSKGIREMCERAYTREEYSGGEHLFDRRQNCYGADTDAQWIGYQFGIAVSSVKQMGSNIEHNLSRDLTIAGSNGKLTRESPGFTVLRGNVPHYDYLHDYDFDNRNAKGSQQESLFDSLPNPHKKALGAAFAQSKTYTAIPLNAGVNTVANKANEISPKEKALLIQQQLNILLGKINNKRGENPLSAGISGSIAAKPVGIYIQFNSSDIQEYEAVKAILAYGNIIPSGSWPPSPTDPLFKAGTDYTKEPRVLFFNAAALDQIQVDKLQKTVELITKDKLDQKELGDVNNAHSKQILDLREQLKEENGEIQHSEIRHIIRSIENIFSLAKMTQDMAMIAPIEEKGILIGARVELDPKNLDLLMKTLTEQKVRFSYTPGDTYITIQEQIFKNDFKKTFDLKNFRDNISKPEQDSKPKQDEKLNNLAKKLGDNQKQFTSSTPSDTMTPGAHNAAEQAKQIQINSTSLKKEQYIEIAAGLEKELYDNIQKQNIRVKEVQYQFIDKPKGEVGESFKIKWENNASMERKFVDEKSGMPAHFELKISANSTPEQIADALKMNAAFERTLEMQPNPFMVNKILEGAIKAGLNIDQKDPNCLIKIHPDDYHCIKDPILRAKMKIDDVPAPSKSESKQPNAPTASM